LPSGIEIEAPGAGLDVVGLERTIYGKLGFGEATIDVAPVALPCPLQRLAVVGTFPYADAKADSATDTPTCRSFSAASAKNSPTCRRDTFMQW
jgi:hypothetical protein